ncbi:MAG TPA: hypothetical protein DEP46_14410 [Blastocatellia bacterium]|nr:hypothetical protein [Blastocatellia bacterium]
MFDHYVNTKLAEFLHKAHEAEIQHPSVGRVARTLGSCFVFGPAFAYNPPALVGSQPAQLIYLSTEIVLSTQAEGDNKW